MSEDKVEVTAKYVVPVEPEEIGFVIDTNPKPVMEFKDQEEVNKYLKEWKETLYLQGWSIKVNLVDRKVLEKEGKEFAGYNDFQMVNQTCVIEITIPDDDIKGRLLKYCMEQILVHELLHLKYNWLENKNDSMQNAYFEILEHQLIEQMSKSLIMAKYGLTLDWFNNF
jgi:hypothetical protein